MSLKLLIADDEDIIRNGVSKYIQLHTNRFDRIYEAADGKTAIELMLKYEADSDPEDTEFAKFSFERVEKYILPLLDAAEAAARIRKLNAEAEETMARIRQASMPPVQPQPPVIQAPIIQ